MINQKIIKKEAKKNIKKHYFRSIILVFVCSLLLAGGFNFTTKNIIDVPSAQKEASKINLQTGSLAAYSSATTLTMNIIQ